MRKNNRISDYHPLIAMDSTAATPINITLSDSSGHMSVGHSHHDDCRIATPAPSTHSYFPYSHPHSLTNLNVNPFAANNYQSYFSRFGASQSIPSHSSLNLNHIPSSFTSPLSSFTALFPPAADMFHYGYSAINGLPTPSPLTSPNSFWPLTGQTYPQIGGLSFANSPNSLSYTTNAHFYNLFSPNSMSSLSPNAGSDGHSPSFYPRIASLPSSYASSPGLSSAFMSPGSLPSLLSPSIGGSSLSDRQPTYLNDSSQSASIKCEPSDGTFHSHMKSPHLINANTDPKKSPSCGGSDERAIERVTNNNVDCNANQQTHHKAPSLCPKPLTLTKSTSGISINESNAHQSKVMSKTKVKEKCAARVEPLMRMRESVDDGNAHRDGISLCYPLYDKDKGYDKEFQITKGHNNCDNNDRLLIDSVNRVENRVENGNIKRSNDESPVNSTESDESMNGINLVKNVKKERIDGDVCDKRDMPLSDSVNLVPHNVTVKDNSVSIDVNAKNDENDKCMIKALNKNLNTGNDSATFGPENSDTDKRDKNAKRESQLKQLQSYRKESHRNSPSLSSSPSIVKMPVAAAIVLPKPKDEVSHSQESSETIPLMQKRRDNVSQVSQSKGSPSTNQKTMKKQNETNGNNNGNNSHAPIAAPPKVCDLQKMPQLTQLNAKSLPKKQPRISRKHSSSSIPIGIAIAQQRTSPKTKSPNESSSGNQQTPLKPLLPTLSIPMMSNSPILITDSPPAGTSLWIKPTGNTCQSNTVSMPMSSMTVQSHGSQSVALSGDYQLARDSSTGQLYLIRNSSTSLSAPTTPTAPKPPTIMPSLVGTHSNMIKNEQNSSAILTVPTIGSQVSGSPQFFANITGASASTLILDTTGRSSLVHLNASPNVMQNHNSIPISSNKVMVSASSLTSSVSLPSLSLLNVERGIQACVSDDETGNGDMKTTATQVDMDIIHSSEDDDDNEGKRFKVTMMKTYSNAIVAKSVRNCNDDDDSSRDSIHLTIVDERERDAVANGNSGNSLVPTDEMAAPVLPVKSAPVMEFIDHHGLDLLVDSIEEFAAREESASVGPVDGLQLLSALAEQRSREERGTTKGSPRRHSTDAAPILNDVTCPLPVKKRQRSESCFATKPIVINNDDNDNEVNNESFGKSMRTSASQTDANDPAKKKRFKELINEENDMNLRRRSERIIIHELISQTSAKDNDNNNNNNNNYQSNDCKKNELNGVVNSKIIEVENEKFDSVANVNDKRSVNDLKNDTSVINDIKRTEKDAKTHKIFRKTQQSNLNIEKQINDSCDANDPFAFIIENQSVQMKKFKNDKKRKIEDNKCIDSESSNPIIVDSDITKKNKKFKKNHREEKEKIQNEVKDIIEKSFKNLDSDKQKNVLNIKLINETKSNENDSIDNVADAKKKKPMEYDEIRMKKIDEIIDEIISRPLSPDNDNEPIEEPKVIEESPQIISNSNDIELTSHDSQLSSDNSLSQSSASTGTSMSCPSSVSIELRLSANDLDTKMDVIMLVDGLLFVGEICPIQAPDIYGIILHGERQHRPHIYSQEEMLREAIREVKPESASELREGQRVCAYWSTQYRHLYPGFVRPSTPHPNLVFVEFDDGDNGRIPFEDIRLLPQEYPQMKINADPLKNLERRRRMSSCGKDKDRKGPDEKNGVTVDDAKTKTNHFKEIISVTSKISQLPQSESRKHSETKSNAPSSISSSISSSSSSPSLCKKLKLNGRDQGSNTNVCVPIKLDMKAKKKKKRTKDDRHHRHHHKHHHCHHHRKCKKHKKSKDEANSVHSTVVREKSTNQSQSQINVTNVIGSTKTGTQSEVQKKSMKDKDRDSQRDSIPSVIKGLRNRNIGNKFKNGDNKSNNNDNINAAKKSKRIIDAKNAIHEKINKRNSESNELSDANHKESIHSHTPKKRERMPSAEKSKIAPFLPDRQLWHWSGKSFKKSGNKGSRSRKEFYKAIERGREHIQIEDCAVFLSTGRPHLPYIGRIDSMWQTGSGNMMVKVRWFYHPEETKGDSAPLVDKRGALFESSHFDVNDVQTISHKCHVISWPEYQVKKKENPLLMLDDPPNIYYLAGQYEALSGRIDMETNVPLKDGKRD